MSALHQPGTVVPGAVRMTLPNEPAVPAYDKKGRPLWDMPKPSGVVSHFKSEGTRRALKAGKMSASDAKVEVPIYRGVSAQLGRSIRSQIRRRNARKKSI